ncbi:hypothetical protein GCM10010218_29660 [Streptomyces mashuensis]|uniref:Uncharacterized protein n=1 Tax=Streptomyces mashuensis TaxID=33904 RepID=A0A919B341_9ACTN|nr:hypothetical protein [Streptomyces mashuensis]GHF46454.1 hypothetical protein GCM10010218_29660 [Streptomyces mashuensis]
MVFGRNAARRGDTEPGLPVADWRDVRRFVVDIVEREAGPGRKRPVLGSGGNAIRVPRRVGQDRVKQPCAFVGSGTVGVRDTGRVVYADQERQRVLCRLDEVPGESGGDERRYVVRDGEGREIGTVRRVPPSNAVVRHTWRIEQPGRPEIVGRNKWVAVPRQEVPARALGTLLGGMLDSALSFGAEEGDQPRERTLLWLADEEEVMQSTGPDFRIEAAWLDRRLAFAVACLGDR